MTDTTEVRFQCTDCGEVFSPEETIAHSVDEECCEWGNHQMYEATFRVYTDEMEAAAIANMEWQRKYYAGKPDRTAALEVVRASGHFDSFEDRIALDDHLIHDHEYGPGARLWDPATARDMHEYAHSKTIDKEWIEKNMH